MIRKEKTNNKTGESTKLLLYYIVVDRMWPVAYLFDQFISNIQEIIDIEWLFELICMFFLSLYPHYKWSGKEEITVKQEKVVNYYYITVP